MPRKTALDKSNDTPATEKNPESDSCAQCVFWLEDKEPGSVGRCGTCRRFPPTVLLDSEDSVMSLWPYTEATDLCGEFKQRVQ